MTSVNMHEAKTHLSRLVARVQSGEDVVISKAGKPVAKLTRVDPPKHKRARAGFLKGKIRISSDFDAPNPGLEKLFDGGPLFPSASRRRRG